MIGLLPKPLRDSARVALDAYRHFDSSDGWAIASHIALSVLLALFPFLIVVTSIAASLFGSKELANEVAQLMLDTWPEEVAGPRSEKKQSAECQGVAVLHPGERCRREAELALHVGQRRRDDRGVEHHHQLAAHDDGEHHPPAPGGWSGRGGLQGRGGHGTPK